MEPREIRVIREGKVAYLLDEAGKAAFYPVNENLPDIARALLARYPSVPCQPVKSVNPVSCLF